MLSMMCSLRGRRPIHFGSAVSLFMQVVQSGSDLHVRNVTVHLSWPWKSLLYLQPPSLVGKELIGVRNYKGRLPDKCVA